MGDVVSNLNLRRRRMNQGSHCIDIGTVDELQSIKHLLNAAIMAASHIEDLEDRNGFVAILDVVSLKIELCEKSIKKRRSET